jgi:hypothetical protein
VKKSKREEVLKLLETDRDRSDASIAREAGDTQTGRMDKIVIARPLV